MVIGLFFVICFWNSGIIEFEDFNILLKWIMLKWVWFFVLFLRECWIWKIILVSCLLVFIMFVGWIVLLVEIRMYVFILVLFVSWVILVVLNKLLCSFVIRLCFIIGICLYVVVW